MVYFEVYTLKYMFIEIFIIPFIFFIDGGKMNLKKKFIGMLIITIVFCVAIASGEYLHTTKTEDKVEEARFSGNGLGPLAYKYQVITGIADDQPEPGEGSIIVNITHNVDINQVIYVTAIMYNETLGLGFTPACSGPHPKGGESAMGYFNIYFDVTNVYIHAPSSFLWGSHYTIVFFYAD